MTMSDWRLSFYIQFCVLLLFCTYIRCYFALPIFVDTYIHIFVYITSIFFLHLSFGICRWELMLRPTDKSRGTKLSDTIRTGSIKRIQKQKDKARKKKKKCLERNVFNRIRSLNFSSIPSILQIDQNISLQIPPGKVLLVSLWKTHFKVFDSWSK